MPPRTESKSAQVRELLKAGMTVADIAKKVGCTPNLVYNLRSTGGMAKKRGPGRPRKASGWAATGIDGILAAVKDSQRQRADLRAALERIQAVVVGVLN